MGRQLDELSVFFSGDPPFMSGHCVIVLLLANKLMMMMMFLKALTVLASTTSFGKLFQILATRAQNQYFLML